MPGGCAVSGGCKIRRGSSRPDCLGSNRQGGGRCFWGKCTPARLESTPVHLESQLLSALVSFVCGTLVDMETPFVPVRLGGGIFSKKVCDRAVIFSVQVCDRAGWNLLGSWDWPCSASSLFDEVLHDRVSEWLGHGH